MGASYGVVSKLSKYDFSKAVNDNLSIDAATSISAQITCGIEGVEEDNNSQTFNGIRESYNITSDGPKLPSSGDTNLWHQEALENPSPIGY